MLSFFSSPLVQTLLRTHPNDVAADLSYSPPQCWEDWWGDGALHWLQLIQGPDGVQSGSLKGLLETIQTLQMDRSPLDIPTLSTPKLPIYGLSPKKQHEVDRMTSFIQTLLTQHDIDPRKLRIVDVGAGQGYLTRSLAFHLRTPRILALDSDEAQLNGAKKWEQRVLGPEHSTITHKTIHITANTLIDSINEWVEVTATDSTPSSVLVVALHACGSLTPSILRALITASSASGPWYPIGLVAVGCCYNLLDPRDLPLCSVPGLDLPPSAPALAAQVPSTWHNTLPSTTLAVKKVVWRALLGREMARLGIIDTVPRLWQEKKGIEPMEIVEERKKMIGVGTNPTMRRLGKLNDSLYNDWDKFLIVAGERLGVDFGKIQAPTAADASTPTLESRLEILHTLRCLLGPVVETFLAQDRVKFLCRGLGDGWKVDAINLFDQQTGSARNIALVVVPRNP